MTERQAEKTVLIVEDDPGIGFVLEQFIGQETRYYALLVTTGSDALQAVSVTRPSLLLLDYHLPGMNGIELYDQLQRMEEGTAIPVIMISATLPLHEIAQRNIIAMKKPFDINVLLQTIENLIQ
jgi:DNA-binding response OmpR family regulator